MRIAVSNIAWSIEEEAEIAQVLVRRGIDAVEVAPTKAFPDLSAVAPREVAAYADAWRAHGIDIVAVQSVLFGRPDLSLFDDDAVPFLRYMKHAIQVSTDLGSPVVVFGSPRNRRVPDEMAQQEAAARSADRFTELGEFASARGVTLCLEPNPPRYGANYLTNAAEANSLVELLSVDGVKLHLDTATMFLADDDASSSIEAYSKNLRHFHVSAVDLGPIETREIDHRAAAESLRTTDYSGIVSVEMRPAERGTAREQVDNALDIAIEAYG